MLSVECLVLPLRQANTIVHPLVPLTLLQWTCDLFPRLCVCVCVCVCLCVCVCVCVSVCVSESARCLTFGSMDHSHD